VSYPTFGDLWGVAGYLKRRTSIVCTPARLSKKSRTAAENGAERYSPNFKVHQSQCPVNEIVAKKNPRSVVDRGFL
jgi:hypothetical protein